MNRALELGKIIERLKGYAKCESGVEAMRKIKPYVKREQAERELSLVHQAGVTLNKIGSSPVIAFSPVGEQLKRAEIGSVLGMGDMLKVAGLMHAGHVAAKTLAGEDIPDGIREIGAGIRKMEGVYKDIQACILSEEEMADSASSALMRIRRSMHACQDKIRTKLNSMISSTSFQKYLQDAIITLRNGKYVLPVKAEYRGSVAGVLHDQSATGATVFIEPMAVVEINNQLTSLKAEERQEIERILQAFSGEIAGYAQELRENAALLVRLDVLFAKAVMAREMKATCPVFSRDGGLELKNARHPLIDPEKVVPVTIAMEKDIRCLLITGPNTGGKTVTLKTAGLLCAMAKCGLFIPAEEGSKMPFFRNVFVDIGDEQSIEQSLSTFSGHVKNLVWIFNHLEDGCLCLLDELGAGTDPTEGAALATAIIDTLIQRDVKVIATTHYAELKAFAMNHPHIQNAGMVFDLSTLSPTYEMVTGVAGKSNAFLIAAKLGMDEAMIENARKRMTVRDIAFEDVLAKAEEYRQQAQREKEKAQQLAWENQAMQTKNQELLKKQQEDTKRILEKAKREAREILFDAQEESKQIVKELRQLKGQLNADQERMLQQAGDSLRHKLEKVGSSIDASAVQPPEALYVGQTVNLLGTGKATVLTGPDTKGELTVQAGMLKIKVHKSKLGTYIETKKQKPAPSRREIARKTTSPEIKLLGMTVEEAVFTLDKYLDDAALCGMEEVRVVHGKGTGALRAGVHQYLKRNRRVKDFRLGRYGEGEDGVTIVQLS